MIVVGTLELMSVCLSLHAAANERKISSSPGVKSLDLNSTEGTAYVSSSCVPHTHKPPPTCPLTPHPHAGTKEKEEAHIPAITIQFGGFVEEPLAVNPRSGLMGSATYPN